MEKGKMRATKCRQKSRKRIPAVPSFVLEQQLAGVLCLNIFQLKDSRKICYYLPWHYHRNPDPLAVEKLSPPQSWLILRPNLCHLVCKSSPTAPFYLSLSLRVSFSLSG